MKIGKRGRWALLLLLVLSLCVAQVPAVSGAEAGAATAEKTVTRTKAETSALETSEPETVRFKKLTVPADAAEIDLGKVKVGSADYEAFYAFLRSLPNLKKVDMFATKVPRKRVEEMAEAFPEIEFGWTMALGDHEVRTDAVAFTTAHSDRSARHKTEDFSVLKYCPNLLALDIGHNAVSDLSFLSDLPNLKILIVVDNSFQDITPVTALKDLEYLELFYNDIRSLEGIDRLTKLKDLNIGFNRIESIAPLENMTWLDRLWITQYNSHNPLHKPDPEAVARLREALPDTQIDSTAKSSVGNGWRKHPRYEAMRKVFRENVWIPLDGTSESPESDNP